jgi:hypothetical protein
VIYQVSRLIESGIIDEISEGAAGNRGGRRPIHLAMEHSFGRVIGIDVQVDAYVAVAVDLAGEILQELRGKVPAGWSDCSDMRNEVIREVTTTLCPDSKRLLGVVVGTGGLIDFRKGRIRYSVPLGVKFSMDFKKTVSARHSCPCHMENDANCCAWGELSFNHDEALRDFIFDLVEFRHDSQSMGRDGGIGVGFGIVLNGKVYSGPPRQRRRIPFGLLRGAGRTPALLAEERARPFRLGPRSPPRGDRRAGTEHGHARQYDGLREDLRGRRHRTLDVDFPTLLRRRLEEIECTP